MQGVRCPLRLVAPCWLQVQAGSTCRVRSKVFRETTRLFSSTCSLYATSTSVTSSPKADVIVVGGGLAGICAAITAAEKGASVLVLDRAHGGGASALSGGVVYAGGGTKYQKAAGYEDTPANMFAYLKQEVGDAVSAKTLQRFCDESVARHDWLESHGARFSSALCSYKTSYPTDKHYLYFSGNEKAHAYAQTAKPAPRGHRMAVAGFSGAPLWQEIFRSAKRLGVQFQPATKVEQILTDGSGRTCGVRCRTLPANAASFSRHKRLKERSLKYHLGLPALTAWLDRRANNIWERDAHEERLGSSAVILAAGGFAYNPDMTKRLMPFFPRLGPLGTSGDDGSGIKLGQALGGSVSHMDRMTAWRFLSPPTAFLEGVAVSKQGDRIAPEDLYGATFSEVMIRKHDGHGFLILDSVQWAKAKSQISEQSQMPMKLLPLYLMNVAAKKARSLDNLAAKFGVPGQQLNRTVQAYNEAILSGKLDPAQKTDEYRSPIMQAPFYGVDVSIQPSGPYVTSALTLGGLRVDEDTGEVLTEKEARIPGLYAAGRTAVGICSNGYLSGLSLADGVFSGKRAGEHAAMVASSS